MRCEDPSLMPLAHRQSCSSCENSRVAWPWGLCHIVIWRVDRVWGDEVERDWMVACATRLGNVYCGRCCRCRCWVQVGCDRMSSLNLLRQTRHGDAWPVDLSIDIHWNLTRNLKWSSALLLLPHSPPSILLTKRVYIITGLSGYHPGSYPC